MNIFLHDKGCRIYHENARRTEEMITFRRYRGIAIKESVHLYDYRRIEGTRSEINSILRLSKDTGIRSRRVPRSGVFVIFLVVCLPSLQTGDTSTRYLALPHQWSCDPTYWYMLFQVPRRDPGSHYLCKCIRYPHPSMADLSGMVGVLAKL